MTTLILGPSGSGKSLHAEELITTRGGVPLYYIATMVPYGEEGARRVEKHRSQRARHGFVTAERPQNVSGLNLEENADVLLEDVSNLLGNVMFGGTEANSDADTVFEDIKELSRKCRDLAVVSIDGLEESGYDSETGRFIAELNRLNKRLADMADTVISMEDGLAVFRKGGAL